MGQKEGNYRRKAKREGKLNLAEMKEIRGQIQDTQQIPSQIKFLKKRSIPRYDVVKLHNAMTMISRQSSQREMIVFKGTNQQFNTAMIEAGNSGAVSSAG